MRLIIGILLLVVIGCTPSKKDLDGMYIRSIERNVITVDGGYKIKLNIDEGSKIIYLVRHAEKDTVPENNPVLTEAGYQRSYLLAEMFKKTRLDAVYSTLYNRTMHTVDSLGNTKGLATKIYQPKDLKQIGIDITESKELNQVIIAGHSNTTPAMANVFMGEKVLESGFDESDYDNFLVVNILPDGQKKLYKLKYK